MTGYEYPGDELDVFSHATRWKRYFASVLRPYVRGSVLEVGAGLGETARALLNPAVSRWVCVEPDAVLAKRLATQQWGGPIQPEIIVGNLLQVPQAERFDAIVYIDVLEHIRADAAELREASKRLAPGGHLIVLSPAFQALYTEFDAALGHERRYTKQSLARVFPGDLERVALFYLDSVGMLLSLANRVALHQSKPTLKQILFWDRRVVPVSSILDQAVGRRFGRSIVGVYRRGEG